MEQLTQNLKNGAMRIVEVPFPMLGPNEVLVRNHYSIISAGTEGRSVSDARKGMVAKARSRQKEVQQVISIAKRAGVFDTYKMVMNKLEGPSQLGYSSAGEVLGIGEAVRGFQVGDLVACGGSDAHHAEVVSVSRNLCVKVPETVDLRHAAFTTIAAIAIQGIRRADVSLGDNCIVMGLGLIGQLAIQLLSAAGVNTIGIDIVDAQVEMGRKSGATIALNRNLDNISQIVSEQTQGHGADAALITAASDSNDPLDLAAALVRNKGKIVVVGRVGMALNFREFYTKELDLKMSMSYGPGRYDANYEEKGLDYPIGHVRWTENRNMQSFINLLHYGKLNIESLITHMYNFEEATDAYQMLLKKEETYAGIVLKYATEKKLRKTIKLETQWQEPKKVHVGLIGAGSFAQNVLLPVMKGKCTFAGIVTRNGKNSRYVSEKYNFSYCTNDSGKILTDPGIDTVFVLNRHNLHARNVILALEHQKNVYVEKPLALTFDELEEIKDVYVKNAAGARLMVGYNRRFSPFVKKIKKIFREEDAKSMNFRINAGTAPKEHWAHDPEVGGGRIIGEVCHFIDLAIHIAGATVDSIYAKSCRDSNDLHDTLVLTMTFGNGSVANIAYFSNGCDMLAKEYLEIFCHGRIAIIDDFQKMKLYGKRVNTFRPGKQDKGHRAEIEEFFSAIENGEPSPIPFEQVYMSTLATLKVMDSINSGKPIQM